MSPPTSSHVFNRQSVQSAIKSVQQCLKRYKTCPQNGIVIFCGLAETGQPSKQRQVIVDFEPMRAIQRFVYRCDSRFHTELLEGLLSDNEGDLHGFVVVDGNGALWGTTRGSTKTVLRTTNIDLPNKHGRGGQSANRFARLRVQARQAHIKKTAETCKALFLSGSHNRLTVKSIVVAGFADMKSDLAKSNFLDKRLSEIIVASIDLSCGGERGFDEAICKSAEILGNVRLAEESKLLQRFFEEIERGSGLCCYAAEDTLAALEMGAVSDLIVWQELCTRRIERQGVVTCEQTSASCSPELQESEESEALVDWLCDHHQEYGCKLHLVSGNTSTGSQFVRGFGGIGGLLRFGLPEETHSHDPESENEEDEHHYGAAVGTNFGRLVLKTMDFKHQAEVCVLEREREREREI